jgi:TRAP-type transport system periplasmic protein
VDYAVASPAHMSTFSKMAPLMDMPFLFRDEDHWRKPSIDAARPRSLIADDILEKADMRILLGYAGGGTRNVFANKPIHNLADMAGHVDPHAGCTDLDAHVRRHRRRADGHRL